MRFIAGVDVGGTFTDALLMPFVGADEVGSGVGSCDLVAEPAQAVLAKVPTTDDPSQGVVAALLEAARRGGVDPSDIELVLNGTTIATNTVVEESGARVGLLVTRGFRYVLEIARSWTPGPISGWMVWDKPAPLADVRDVREIGGRIDARGELVEPFDDDAIRTSVAELRDRGIEAITVSLLNGYTRPDLEAHVGSIAEEAAPGLPVSLASSVLPEFREYERTLAAVANAYVQPAMRRYLGTLEHELTPALAAAVLNIVRSDGGVMGSAEATARPIETVFSGPAGGARAAVHLAELLGYADVLSFDMGGTSTDVSLNRAGHAAVSRKSSLTAYYKVRVPSVDVVSIGAGGGSIAHVPMTGALRVGPASAGSSPGPACYARGGEEPTVTDANAVLGYLPSLLGGRMILRRDLAELAVDRVARTLGLGLEEAAAAIIAIANEKMLSALRLVSVQRGHDPRRFALVAFGGAGPLHANALLQLLGSPLCVIPPTPGVFSTFGFLVADVRREFARSHIRPFSRLTSARVLEIVAALEAQARAWLGAEGFDPEHQRISYQFDMRYFRQGFELRVAHPDPLADRSLLRSLADRFVEAHRRTYQFELEVEPELVVVRCIATGAKPRPELHARAPAEHPPEDAIVAANHQIVWEGDWVPAPVYERALLGPGHVVAGPAVIEQEDSTTLVHPGFHARVDPYLDLILERG